MSNFLVRNTEMHLKTPVPQMNMKPHSVKLIWIDLGHCLTSNLIPSMVTYDQERCPSTQLLPEEEKSSHMQCPKIPKRAPQRTWFYLASLGTLIDITCRSYSLSSLFSLAQNRWMKNPSFQFPSGERKNISIHPMSQLLWDYPKNWHPSSQSWSFDRLATV